MKTYFVDSFANQPFKGNLAAVCITEIALAYGAAVTVLEGELKI